MDFTVQYTGTVRVLGTVQSPGPQYSPCFSTCPNLVVRALIIGVGVVGSLFLLVAVSNDRTSKLGTRLLIINIAIAAFLAMVVGQTGTNIYIYFHISGSCSFHVINSILIDIVAANWAEVTLALNRMIAVCYPHQYNRFSSGKVAD